MRGVNRRRRMIAAALLLAAGMILLPSPRAPAATPSTLPGRGAGGEGEELLKRKLTSATGPSPSPPTPLPRWGLETKSGLDCGGEGSEGGEEGSESGGEGSDEPSRTSDQPDSDSKPQGDLVLVLGAPGTEEFGAMFSDWAAKWEAAAKQGGCRVQRIAVDADAPAGAAREALHVALTTAAMEPELPLWLVLIGHGTYDSRVAKFNLPGDDVSSTELAAWVDPLPRPVAVINCASASGPFIDDLSGRNRVIITATRSGEEVNLARFGGGLAAALVDPAADFDKDGQVSLLEAFLKGARATEEFYSGDNRLATEHPLLDDNGDARGTRAGGFEGVRPIRDREAADTLDGYLAHQWRLVPSESERNFPAELRTRRDDLERQVFDLRDRRGEFTEEEYYAAIEPLLVELAKLYEQAEHDAAAGNSKHDQTPAVE